MWHILVKPESTSRDEPGKRLDCTILVGQPHRDGPLALPEGPQTTTGGLDTPGGTEHSSSDESTLFPDWRSDAEERHDIPQVVHAELRLWAAEQEAVSLTLSFPQSTLILCHHHRIRDLGVDPRRFRRRVSQPFLQG